MRAIPPTERYTETYYAFKKALFSKMMVQSRPGEVISYLDGCKQHPKLWKLHFPEPGDEWTYLVGSTGQRFGKTIAEAAEGQFELALPGTRTWVVAPNYELTDRCYDYVWEWTVRQGVLGPPGRLVAKSRTKDNRYIETRDGSFLKGKSADSPDSLVGEQLDFIIVDEAARIAQSIWDDNLDPRLANRKGRAMLVSSPRGKNWFYKFYLRGLNPKTREIGWRCFKGKTVDNPFVDDDWVQDRRLTTPTKVFKQEYEGEFIDVTGQIFPDFEDDLYNRNDPAKGGHLFDPKEIVLDRSWTYGRAIDIGIRHPTACLWYAVDPDGNVYFYREYREHRPSYEDHARAINALTGGDRISVSYISPDAARKSQLTADHVLAPVDVFAQEGIIAYPAANAVEAGISECNRYLKSTLEAHPRHPKVLVSVECKMLREAIMAYVWEEPVHHRERDAPAKPKKYEDDLQDAFRYALASRPTHEAWSDEQYMDLNYLTQGTSGYKGLPGIATVPRA